MQAVTGEVLIVDDEPAVRRVCERMLRDVDLRVSTAASGAEALLRLGEKDWDCVLTDMSMPGSLDGAALLEEIRRRLPATDVLIMTGGPTIDSAVACLKGGARDYLIKPLSPASLIAAIRGAVERRRLSPERAREGLLRRELASAYGELQRVERMKDAFLSTVSHELRTPLAVAITAAELLASQPASEDAAKVQKILRSSLSKEEDVVKDLLLCTQLASPDIEVESSAVDLEELAGEMVEDTRVLWEERRLSVVVTFQKPLAPIFGDPALLRAAIKQLLLNAIRFNREGGRVQIIGEEHPGFVTVHFADTGCGIAPEEQPRVFDRFYQVADHMTRRVGGLGLGLAIARRAVEAQGGSLSVRSRDGTGSVFELSLPRERAAGGRGAPRPSSRKCSCP